MWRNYLTVGFRALTRSKTYAFINIFGLALGLAACLMLLIYVRYETSYDRWLPDADRVYQVQSISTSDDNAEPVAAAGRRTASSPRASPTISRRSRRSPGSTGDEPVFLRNGEPSFVDDARWPTRISSGSSQLPFLRGDPRDGAARHGQPGAEPQPRR